jgi:hypothetical protein
VFYASTHLATTSTCEHAVRNKYRRTTNLKTQEYGLTSCDVVFGGLRGFGGTCSVYPKDGCRKYLSSYLPHYKAWYCRRQASPEIRVLALRHVTFSKQNKSTYNQHKESSSFTSLSFFCFCVPTKNATSFTYWNFRKPVLIYSLH